MNKKKRKRKDQPARIHQHPASGPGEVSLEERSLDVTLSTDTGETAVLTLHRHYINHLISEIEQYGRAILWDLGILKQADAGADTEFILEPFLNADSWRPRLLFDRHQLVGKVAHVIYLPKEEGPASYFLKLYFPVNTILERIAGHQNVPVSQLHQQFQQQLEVAFPEMNKSGEGRLPGFGTLRCDESKLPWFLFEPDENLAPFIEEADHDITHVLRPWYGVVPQRAGNQSI